MVRMIMVFAAVLLVPFAAFAASNEFVWSEPGVDPFKGDIAMPFERFVGIPPAAKAKLVAKVKKSVVMADVLKKHINASSMAPEEKERALKLAGDQPFFNTARLERLGLPHVLLVEIIKEVDTSGYTAGEIAPGQKCDWMAFGRDKVVPRVVYKPAEKVREPKLKAHFFSEAEAGVTYTVAQPLVCDNLCFWRVEVGLVKRFEAPAQAATTTRKAVMAGPARQVAAPQFRLLVNLFKDRDDGLFRERYRAAKQQPSEKTAYRRAVLEFGHNELIAERRARSLAEAPFHVQVIGRDGTIVATHVLTTDATGQAVLRLPAEFSEIRVVPDNRLSDIIPQEGFVRAKREEFDLPYRERGLTALQVWFIQAPGLERR